MKELLILFIQGGKSAAMSGAQDNRVVFLNWWRLDHRYPAFEQVRKSRPAVNRAKSQENRGAKNVVRVRKKCSEAGGAPCKICLFHGLRSIWPSHGDAK